MAKFIGTFLASLGLGAIVCWLIFAGALAYVWWQGVCFGFHHSIVVGIVSIIPPVGFIEGLLHLLNVI